MKKRFTNRIKRLGLKPLVGGAFSIHRWITPKVKTFEESPYIRLFVIAAILVFPLQYFTERSNRDAESEARAWERLTTPASGNSGKVGAIQFLISNGIDLPNLDLSCRTQGKMEGGGACQFNVYLQRLDISFASTKRRANLEYSDLSDVDLRYSKLSGAAMNDVKFDGATLFKANLEDTFLIRSTFRGTYLQFTNFKYADLTGADFSAAKGIAQAQFWRSNLSGTRFPEQDNSRITSGFYYVKGHPPVGIPLDIVNHFVCSGSLWPHLEQNSLIDEGCIEVNP